MAAEFSRTAVFHAADQPLELTTVAIPELQSGECLVRITACTLCGSDLHSRYGRRPSPAPSILGHEIIGVVEATCSGETQVELPAIGDRVTWSVAASCHQCRPCTNQMPQKCETLFKYGHAESGTDPLSGGLSEYCILRRGTTIVKVPNELPDAVACPASCATATVAAAIRSAGTLTDRHVLVTGAGMLGLTATAMLAMSDAREITVCDIDPARLKLATTMGATSIVEKIPEQQFDVILEMTGNAGVVEQVVRQGATGGTIVLVGSVTPSRDVSFSPEQIVRRLLTIRGVHNYQPQDLIKAIEFLAASHRNFPFADVVERWFSLNDAEEAMLYAEQSSAVRIGIRPEGI